MRGRQDLFISHAGTDKEEYIFPLTNVLTERGVTFWLDSVEITWGARVTENINRGLSASRYVLLCLSKNFLNRPWPESEMGAVLARQIGSRSKRLLPLILNSRNMILRKYPLLADLAYREFDGNFLSLTDQIISVVKNMPRTKQKLGIVVESIHTGKICNLLLEPSASVKWLSTMGQKGLGVRELADTGAPFPFKIRWVLVDTKAEAKWKELPREIKRKLRAFVKVDKDYRRSLSDIDRLQDVGVYDGIVFHLYPVEDEDYLESRPAAAFAAAPY